MILGTTYSKGEAKHLGLSHSKVFEDLLNSKFDILRLGCYWSDIEQKPGIFNFDDLDAMLNCCDQQHQKVILTVGMKAPRWPEFYIPAWLEGKSQAEIEKQCFQFIRKTVHHLRSHPSISYWQVENEPLDPSGPKQLKISLKFLTTEVARVRSLDDRPIVLTFFAHLWGYKKRWQQLEKLGDIIGIDLYYRIYGNHFFTFGSYLRDLFIRWIAKSATKPIWITELQAEPWEKNETEKLGLYHPTFTRERLSENYRRAKALGPEAIFFWGYEYWVFKKYNMQHLLSNLE